MEVSTNTIQKLRLLREHGFNAIEDLNEKYFINSENEIEVDNILKLLNENACSFKEIVNKFKSMKDSVNDPCLKYLLDNKKVFKKLIENNRLTQDDLRYMLNTIDKHAELCSLCWNTNLLKYIVENELFQELVDKFKNMKNSDNDPCLYELLKNKEFFEELIENNKLTKEDLRYLLNTIDKIYELDYLCDNTSLIKHILNEFILDTKDGDRFNTIIENSSWYKDRDIHTIFDYIEYENKDNEEILKLNDLNKKIYTLNNFDLTDEQRLEIHEILRNNEIARNTLIQIIDSHLEDQYDFETLKELLTKNNDKNLKTKFNF